MFFYIATEDTTLNTERMSDDERADQPAIDISEDESFEESSDDDIIPGSTKIFSRLQLKPSFRDTQKRKIIVFPVAARATGHVQLVEDAVGMRT